MSFHQSIVAVALLSTAASAHAGLAVAVPEPAAVTLIFIGMAVVGLVAGKARRRTDAAELAPAD